MESPPSEAQTWPTRHGLLWTVAILIGGASIGLWWLFHASFEYDSWYPRGLRRLFNRNEIPFSAAVGAGGIALSAAFMYWRGWFPNRPPKPSIDPAAAQAQFAATGAASFPVALLQQGRACYGTLMINPAEMSFLCYYDESFAAGVAGKAAAAQFGLVGGLVGGAASAARAQKRDAQIAAAKQAVAHLPMDQQFAQNRHSFRIPPNQLTGLLRGGAGVGRLVATAGEMQLLELSRENLPLLVGWLRMHNLQSEI